MSSTKTLDYKAIQLKVGLEVHQQLATKTKLFCACPPYLGEGSQLREARPAETVSGSKVPTTTYEFRRILRPVTSELGELDEAAKFESRKEIRVRYLVDSKTSCLVEADEEPPHPISEEALETSLLFALALNSRVSDEIHVMRKIVVDGSNTSGFQRTAVVALGGSLSYNNGTSSVGVQSISVEEDAARAIKAEAGTQAEAEGEVRTYALDRLGTPLVEVALAPIEGSHEDIEDAARTLGRLMRSTGRIARGLGTIRQDLNVSVMNGKVIEVKGVQRLDQIGKVVLYEASRQKFFHNLAKEIEAKIGANLEISTDEVTSLLAETKSSIIKRALSGKAPSIVSCISIKKFAGFIGRENEFHSRLGKELGAIAKTYGLGGVFHSDELPNHGITQEDVERIKEFVKIGPDDAFVLVAGPAEKVKGCADALIARLRHCAIGVPAETRAATLEGETLFLRPRPGAARMYPETDIPLIQVSKAGLEELRKEIPEPWDTQVRKFAQKYDLPNQLAEPLFDSDYRELFESVVAATKLSSRYVASVLVDTFLSLSREGVPVFSIGQEKVAKAFAALDGGRFAKEAVPAILRQLAGDSSLSLDQALARTGLGAITEAELVRIVDEIIEESKELLKTKGEAGAQSALMGRVMQKVRGRADGKHVSQTVSKRLATYFQKEKVNQ